MKRVLTVAAAVVVVAAAAGCADQAPGEAGAAQPSPSVGPVSGQAQVAVFYTGVPGVSRHPSAAVYEATVELGAVVAGGAGCSLAAPEGTVTVPVTLTLVNTDDPDAPAPAVPSPGSEAEPLRAAPFVSVETVGEVGPLRWEDPRGADCTDQPELRDTDAWQYREQVQVHGHLTGVPADDPQGVGVRASFTRQPWQIHEGEPEPLTVTY